MIETKPLVWSLPQYQETLVCFIQDCHEPARHLAKIRRSDVIIQVCLCEECLRKSTSFILQGLVKRSRKTLN
ncbi:MAG: hypothetical protein BBJ60_00695 [Desulfobacterales bacterium S7086C20]|nr:MAG: hypothetical protein BBJ60_00695 [Desulfobacterales bacterium S7086C20]